MIGEDERPSGPGWLLLVLPHQQIAPSWLKCIITAAVHVLLFAVWVMEPRLAAADTSFSRQSKGRVRTRFPERCNDDILSSMKNDIEFAPKLRSWLAKLSCLCSNAIFISLFIYFYIQYIICPFFLPSFIFFIFVVALLRVPASWMHGFSLPLYSPWMVLL